MTYPPFHLLNYMPYQHELQYFRGTSLAGYRERKSEALMRHLQRLVTLWSVLLAIALSISPAIYV